LEERDKEIKHLDDFSTTSTHECKDGNVVLPVINNTEPSSSPE